MAGSVLVGGGQPLTVALSQSGSAVSLYYDQSLSTSIGTSITIHADTIFWVPEGIYTASVKTAAGVELEGGSITVQSLGRVVLNEQQVAISTLGVLGKGGEIATPLAAYAPILTTAGAPTTGLWTAGQSVVDSNGIVWNCTVGGTPGTWVQVTPNTELGYFSSNASISALASTTLAAVTGYTKTVTVPNNGRPVYVDCSISLFQTSNAGAGVFFDIYEDGVSTTAGACLYVLTAPAASGFYAARFRCRRTPAAGSHTYSVFYKVSAGTLAIANFNDLYDMAITQG